MGRSVIPHHYSRVYGIKKDWPSYTPHNYTPHNYTPHTYTPHTYTPHNYTPHTYTPHTYMYTMHSTHARIAPRRIPPEDKTFSKPAGLPSIAHRRHGLDPFLLSTANQLSSCAIVRFGGAQLSHHCLDAYSPYVQRLQKL